MGLQYLTVESDNNLRLQRCKTVNGYNIYFVSYFRSSFLPSLILVFDPYLFFDSVETGYFSVSVLDFEGEWLA